MADNRTDRPYWCEICARKKECYGITLKPKCFVPIADRKTEQTEPQRTEAKSIEDMSINEARSEFTRLKAFAEGYQKGKEDEHRWWSNHCANCTDYKDEPQIDGAIDEARFKAHCMNCQRDVADIKCLDCDGDKYFIPDEPQTDCSWK